MTKREYERLAREWESRIRREFGAWVSQARAGAQMGGLAALVTAGDVDGLMRALGVTPAELSALTESARGAFVAGGTAELRRKRRRGRAGAFDVRATGAERWTSAHAARLVSDVIDSQRGAIVDALSAGIRSGQSPMATARDIVGRVDGGGRRSGGVIGLTAQQAGYVSTARAQLLSGDPESLRQYLTRARRDRRFDPLVRRAIQARSPLDRRSVDRITGRYSDSLLALRGEAIARSEAITALNAAREEAVSQAVGAGDIDPRHVVRIWRHSGKSPPHGRETHIEMNGQRRAFGVPFDSPTGAQLMHPGDTSLGAGPEDIVNCGCYEQIEYDFIGAAA